MDSPPALRRAVFLDRDGTLIHDPGYLAEPGHVRVLPGVGDALRSLAARGPPGSASGSSAITCRL